MKDSLYEKLMKYGGSDHYPLHMPGHKRRGFSSFDPYSVDITEIEGFDNLHDPKGLIKDLEERLAALYGVKRSYLLVNGVTGGIFNALSATTHPGDTILMARNSHRAVYGGVIAGDLKVRYIYPEYAGCLMGGIRPQEVERALKEEPDIRTVVITSPTYEGFVSDIKEIARIVHEGNRILVVDEAHGAHLHFGESFPESAVKYADIILHGAHKTLPAFTQSAFIHIASDRVDVGRLESFLGLYQTSSPSYILMAGMDRCVSFLEKEGKERFVEYEDLLSEIRKKIRDCKALSLVGGEYTGRAGIFDIDKGKLVVLPDHSSMDGHMLSSRLRDEYRLECEMADEDHIIAMTSVMDSKDGLSRFAHALNQMDKTAEYISEKRDHCYTYPRPEVVMTQREAFSGEGEEIPLEKAVGRTSAGFVYGYPPGIPIIAPGERITREMIGLMEEYMNDKTALKGLTGPSGDLIKVVI